MGKRIILVSGVLLFFVFLAGCAIVKPLTILTDFIEAGKRFNFEEMATAINPADKNYIERLINLARKDSTIEGPYQKHFYEYFKKNAEKITFDVQEAKVKGDKAFLKVKFTYVDGTPFFKATVNEVLAKAASKDVLDRAAAEEEMALIFREEMDKQKEKFEELFVDKVIDINFIFEGKEWYIDNPSEELLDVFTSNFISASSEIAKTIDYTKNEEERG